MNLKEEKSSLGCSWYLLTTSFNPSPTPVINHYSTVELLNAVIRFALQAKKRSFCAAADPLQGWSDEELRQRYRFGRRGLNFLTDMLENNLQRPTRRSYAILVTQQILIALRF